MSYFKASSEAIWMEDLSHALWAQFITEVLEDEEPRRGSSYTNRAMSRNWELLREDVRVFVGDVLYDHLEDLLELHLGGVRNAQG